MSAPCCTSADGSCVGPDEVRDELWVVGGPGHLRRRRPPAPTSQTVEGWVLPGLVDAHCHVGLDAHGAVDRGDRRAAGAAPTATPAPCSSATPARRPTPAGSTTARTCPRIIRAGRHIARTRRYIRNYAHEIEPEDLARRTSRLEARRGDGWVKLVGDWIDRDTGDLAPCWPRGGAGRRRSPRRTTRAPGSPRTASARSRCATSPRPASTASSTRPG